MYQVPQDPDRASIAGREGMSGIFFKVVGGILGGFFLGAMGYMALVMVLLPFSGVAGLLALLFPILSLAVVPGLGIGWASAFVQQKITRSVPQQQVWPWYAATIVCAMLATGLSSWVQLGAVDLSAQNRVVLIMMIGAVGGGISSFIQQRIAKLGGDRLNAWAGATVLGWGASYGLISAGLAIFFDWVGEWFIM